MQVANVGRVLLSLSSIGLGAVLVWKGLTLPWRPLLSWPPTSAAPAFVVGAILVVSGLALFTRRFAPASLGLGLVWLLLGLPSAMAKPVEFLSWYGVVEGLSFGCGGWVLLACAGPDAGPDAGRFARFAADPKVLRQIQTVFGVTLVFYGISHFLLLAYTASLIPAVFPARLALAAFTGGAHIAAGAALVLGILPRLAVLLEAMMLAAFGVIVQLPMLLAKPAERTQWVEVFASFALAGAAFAIASAIGEKPRSNSARIVA